MKLSKPKIDFFDVMEFGAKFIVNGEPTLLTSLFILDVDT